MTDPALPFLDTAPFAMVGWEIRPSRLQAVRNGEVRQLEPKVMGVLCTLAQHAGTTVTRQTFFDAVWGETIVSDDVLTRCVSELRKLFGDNARAPRVIETVPRVGYRLLAPVTWRSAGGDSLPEPGVEHKPPAEVGEPSRGAEPVRSRWPLGLAALCGGLMVLAVGYVLERQPEPTLQPLVYTPVTSMPGMEMSAALSPDGTRIAFVHSAGGDQRLMVAALDGSAQFQLTDGPGRFWSPTWSPDGLSLAFIERKREACSMLTVSALGGPVQRIGPCYAGDFTTLDWSPDGHHLATEYMASPGTVTSLALVNVATGDMAPIEPNGADSKAVFGPRYSPDGTRLLFIQKQNEAVYDLFVLHLESGHITQIPTRGKRPVEHESVVGYAWVSDQAILYSVLRDGHTSLWRIPLAPDGSTATPEWVPVNEDIHRLTAHENLVVTEQWTIKIQLTQAPLGQPTETSAFAPSTALDYHPHWSPDGERVAFLSDRLGPLQVWVSDADGARAKPVTDLDHVSGNAPRWSPDGQRIAFTALADGQSEVFVIDHDGARPRALSAPTSNEFDPNWSHDGRWLFVVSDRSGRSEIWKVPLDGGEAVQVTQEGGVLAQPSPDGRWLYITQPDAGGLWRRSMTEETSVLVSETSDDSRPYAWQPYAGGVYITELRPDGDYDLVALSEDGERRAVHRIPDSRLFGFAVSPDAAAILVWSFTSREADLASFALP